MRVDCGTVAWSPGRRRRRGMVQRSRSRSAAVIWRSLSSRSVSSRRNAPFATPSASLFFVLEGCFAPQILIHQSAAGCLSSHEPYSTRAPLDLTAPRLVMVIGSRSCRRLLKTNAGRGPATSRRSLCRIGKQNCHRAWRNLEPQIVYAAPLAPPPHRHHAIQPTDGGARSWRFGYGL